MFENKIQWLNRAAVGLILAGLVAGATLGVGPMKQRVASLRTDPLQIDFVWPRTANADPKAPASSWMPESEKRRLLHLVSTSVAPDPFSASSLQLAQDRLEHTGWFIDGPTLARAPRGEISVRGDWRVPAAAVRHGSRDFLVAREGRLLPLEYPAGTVKALPIVVGAYAGPPPAEDGGYRYGEFWLGTDVQSALKLIDYLRASPTARQAVEAIDVSRFGADERLIILTREGGRIVWGKTPGRRHPGEQADDEKLRRFELILTDESWKAASTRTLHIYTPTVYFDRTAGGG